MRICVLGNSHIASLRLGWDQIAAEMPGISLVFFGSHKLGLARLEAAEGRLVASNHTLAEQLAFTSGGPRDIVFADYDACLLYGLYLVAPRLDARLSRAVRDATLKDAVAGTLSMTLCQLARSVTQLPLFVAHNPLRAVDPADPVPDARPMLPYEILTAEMERQITTANTHLLRQPAETILPSLHTRPEYSTGSVRLEHVSVSRDDLAHRATDTVHMNALFGATFLRQHLPGIAARLSPAPGGLDQTPQLP